jgi:hypothetical protein
MNELSQAQPAGAGYTVTSVWLSRGENPIISFLFFLIFFLIIVTIDNLGFERSRSSNS